MVVGELPREAKLARIDELLELTYRSQDLGNVEDPLAEAVFILLSRQTQGPVFLRTFAAIRTRYPLWKDLLEADPEELADLLSPSGLHRQRSSQLIALLEAVKHDNTTRGVGPADSPPTDLTLEHLREMGEEEAHRFLLSLPGIGEKSARCILSYSLGREAFAVDTHIRRILDHVDLVPYGEGKVDHGPYDDLVPPKMRRRLHVNLIHHGREVCRSGQPRCGDCVLVSFCPTGRASVAEAASDKRGIVDLCAGAGGLTEGFNIEGYRPAAAVEIDRDAAQTYRANHPGVPVMEADVTSLDGADLVEFAPGAASPFAVVSGTPCQGYSMAGSRDPEDPRNSMFKHVIRLSKDLGTRVVVIENVPGLRRVKGTSFLDSILDALRTEFGWADRYLLTASEFGVPQNRQRYFFVAASEDEVANGADGLQPEVTHIPADSEAAATGLQRTITLKEALRDLPEFGPGVEAEWVVIDGRVFLNASTMRHSDRVVKKIAGINQGEGPISYRRLEDDVARTLVAGHRALPVHPWLDRTISVREAARIQAFEDSYVFAGKRSNQPLQVANAVPPPLAAAIARYVRKLVPSEQ